ncbi:nucleoside triphosphate pyrophosphohydrolase [Alphaproteobacteria bacterium]|nr:nucleoside triphosphate pyrophosphohydrolase [Alphaproteobacteria bacterium]
MTNKNISGDTSISLEKLLDVMKKLRDPINGCPWDIKQDFKSIAPYTIEEAYEVWDAIQIGKTNEIKEELGDLLFQIVFHAEIASEKNLFQFSDIANSASKKMIDRHPHVFKNKPFDKNNMQINWEKTKINEKKILENQSILDNISISLPSLKKAIKIQNKAATVGFDWRNHIEVLEKIDEEVKELKIAIDSKDLTSIEEELGDLIFTICNLARHLKVDPEESLQKNILKFYNRFTYIEKSLKKQNLSIEKSSLKQLNEYWNEAKNKEKNI